MSLGIRYTLIFTLSLGIASGAFAQLTPSDFLLTAFDALNTKEFDEKVAFLDKKSYRLPFAEELEVRYSNDERTLEDARYRLRLRAANPWKIRRNNALFNALQKEISLEQQIVFNENLYERYLLLLDYLITFKETELLEQRYLLANKKLTLFQENTQADFFDARDYVDAKLETIERLEDLEESHIELLNLELEIKLILQTDALDWSNIELISIDQVSSLIPNLILNPAQASELNYLQQQIEVARLETSKERADFDIGYVQAQLAPNVDDDETSLGFSVGFTIPIFRSNKDQIAERILDEIEITNEFAAEAFKDSVLKVLEYQFLQDQIVQHQKLRDNIRQTDVNILSKNLAISEGYNPISLLTLEDGKLKLEQLIIRSKKRVLEQFIELLFVYDALHSKPLTNYLHKDLKIIE